MKNLFAILSLNCLGLGLIITYAWPDADPYWSGLDAKIFFYFNNLLASGVRWLDILGLANMRAFDVVAFLAMGAVYFRHFSGAGAAERRRLFCLGLLMLGSAIVLKYITQKIALFVHPSPTLYFEGVARLSELSFWAAKDASGNSFPGDHGMLLLLFAAFAARYLGRAAFFWSLLIAVIFSLPRIAAGAHWASDVLVGSLGYVLLFTAWLLLTPASDKLTSQLERLFPLKLFGATADAGKKKRPPCIAATQGSLLKRPCPPKRPQAVRFL